MQWKCPDGPQNTGHTHLQERGLQPWAPGQGQGQGPPSGACTPARAALSGLHGGADSIVPMAGAERTRSWAEPMVPRERDCHARTLATGATGPPSEARRAEAQPCSRLAGKQPRPARTLVTPCGLSPAPRWPDTCPGAPLEDGSGTENLPKRDSLSQQRPKHHQFANSRFPTPLPPTLSEVEVLKLCEIKC